MSEPLPDGGDPGATWIGGRAHRPVRCAWTAVDELDRVLMTECRVEGRCGHEPMAAGLELGDHTVDVAWLEVDLERWFEMIGRLHEPTRGRDRGPHVEPAIDEGADELGMDLRLRVPAHRARNDPRTGDAVAEQHP